jgi:hypothetical protein
MDREYWLNRNHAALGMAKGASSAEAKLFHYELAGLYSIKAAQCAPPFIARRDGPLNRADPTLLLRR